MALSDYVTLGRSGMRVSPLCLGTMTFGMDWDWGSTPEDSARIIDAYLDRGGNFLDTANIYTKGHAEAIIGEHLEATGKRDRVVIATKFMGNMFPGDPNGGGAHRKGIVGALDESLRRLRTDSVDLYWMHFRDAHTPIEETMRVLDDLVRAGKVRTIGFSDTPAWVCSQAQTMAMFRGWTALSALQIEYSLLERTVEHELIPMAREMHLGVTPWSPLKGGLLTGKYTRSTKRPDDAKREWMGDKVDERALSVIDALLSVAGECGASPAQVALAWVQSRAGVASTIIGARTMKQLDDNLGALDVTLTPEQVASLDAASAIEPIFPHAFLNNSRHVTQGGTTVNGVTSDPWPLAPKTDDERW